MFSLWTPHCKPVGFWTGSSVADPEISPRPESHPWCDFWSSQIFGIVIGFQSATFLKLHEIKEGNATNNILWHFMRFILKRTANSFKQRLHYDSSFFYIHALSLLLLELQSFLPLFNTCDFQISLAFCFRRPWTTVCTLQVITNLTCYTG